MSLKYFYLAKNPLHTSMSFNQSQSSYMSNKKRKKLEKMLSSNTGTFAQVGHNSQHQVLILTKNGKNFTVSRLVNVNVITHTDLGSKVVCVSITNCGRPLPNQPKSNINRQEKSMLSTFIFWSPIYILVLFPPLYYYIHYKISVLSMDSTRADGKPIQIATHFLN